MLAADRSSGLKRAAKIWQSFPWWRAHFLDTEAALDKNGVIIGLRSRHLDDCGGYTRYEPPELPFWAQVYNAMYTIRNIKIDFTR